MKIVLISVAFLSLNKHRTSILISNILNFQKHFPFSGSKRETGRVKAQSPCSSVGTSCQGATRSIPGNVPSFFYLYGICTFVALFLGRLFDKTLTYFKPIAVIIIQLISCSRIAQLCKLELVTHLLQLLTYSLLRRTSPN
jgi:hypothetical protein